MHNTLSGGDILGMCVCVRARACSEGSSPAPVHSNGAVRGQSVYGSGSTAQLDYVFGSRCGCNNVKRNI